MKVALRKSRWIGTAIGIIMADRRIREADAFSVLVDASQHTNRKLNTIAVEIVATGDTTTLRPVSTLFAAD